MSNHDEDISYEHSGDHEDEEDFDISMPCSKTSSSSRHSQFSSSHTAEKFIEILSRDEEEGDDVHLNDYNYVLSALAITTEPHLAKLACQAIDKCVGHNSSWVIPAASALSSLLTGTPDRGVKISCAQALNRIVKLSTLDSSSITTLVTLLQIAIACNSADQLLSRHLQEGLNSLQKLDDNGAGSNDTTTEQHSSSGAGGSHHDDHHHSTTSDHSSLSKRGNSYDLPSDNSITVTEEQLSALGAIQQHLWKALRFKIQRFFVPNVTTPQKLEVHSFLTPIQLQGLMRLSGFTCHSDTDFFTKQHWERLVDTIDRIYDGKESRLDAYRGGDAGSHSDHNSSYKSRGPPASSSSLSSSSAQQPPHVDRLAPPDTKTDPNATAYPKYLILQGIPASHADPMDIYDFLKANRILFSLDKRDIQVTVPANPSADHTASLRFRSHEDAAEAFNKITTTLYYNQKILYADYSMTNPARVLFMYKIIRYVTKESLAEGLKVFCKQGTVEKVDLPMNSSFGYITLTEIDDAIRVYRTLLKSAEGGLWIPVADSTCGEQVLVFFKYSKFPDPPRSDPEKHFANTGGSKNFCILRVANLHEHDLTDLESICKRSGECNRLNILKGSAVYQFKFADCAEKALLSLQASLKHVQSTVMDLAEYRGVTVEEPPEGNTGGYDPSKMRHVVHERGGDGGRGRGRGRGRDDRRPFDRNFGNSRRPDDRFDPRRDNEFRRFDDRRHDRNDRTGDKPGDRNERNDRNDRNEKVGDRNERNDRSERNESRRDEIEVDYSYDDNDKAGDNDDRNHTPRVERSGGDNWGNKDQDEEENGNREQHYRRSRWGDDDVDSDRDNRRFRNEDRDDESRKRPRSPSHEDGGDDKKGKTVYDQRTWEREAAQAQYNRSRGRGRGRGFSKHETYR